MRREIDLALKDADLVMLVLDATRTGEETDSLVRLLAGRKVLAVLNKVDLVREKKELLPGGGATGQSRVRRTYSWYRRSKAAGLTN